MPYEQNSHIMHSRPFCHPGYLVVHGQQNGVQDSILPTNNTSSQNIFEQVIWEYQHGIKFKDVISVAIGILAFSYFIWKTSMVLSKCEVFQSKNKYTAEGIKISPGRRKILYIVKYLIIFPMMLWLGGCLLLLHVCPEHLAYLWNFSTYHGGNYFCFKNSSTLE